MSPPRDGPGTRGAGGERRSRTIALLPFGDLFDDFLDSIGVSLEAFCNEMTGGWLFGYVEALRLAGVRTVIVIVSARVTIPTEVTHRPTGATICILPPPGPYRALRRLRNGRAAGRAREGRRWSTPGRALAGELLPYLATPLGALARIVRREGCAAILCQEYESPRFDTCVLLGRLLRVPVFATFQGGDFQRGYLERVLRPPALHLASGIIVATGSEARRVRARYRLPARKLARVFNPLDLREYGPAERDEARAALGIPPEARVAVWHGRVAIGAKGLDILLAAWEQICRARPGRDLRLLLIGSGPDAEELRRRLATVRAPGIGWVDRYLHDRAAVRRYLAAADVYAFASRHEGFPVAPIEALACGLPVVAASAQGIPDILAGGEVAGGLIVPRDDAPAFARALGGLLDDPARARELGARGRARAAGHFSLEVVGRQLATFLGLLPEGRR